VRYRQRSTCNSDPDGEHNEPEEEEYDGPGPRELRSHARDFPAVGTPSERIVEGVEQEGIVTVCTGHTAHSWNIGCGDGGGGAGRQVDDSFTVRSGAGDLLGGALADQETVARTPHILAARWGVSDGRGLAATPALHHQLIFLARDVNHVLTDPTCHHWHSICVGRRKFIRTRRDGFFHTN